jgi:hypothetical protein
VPSDAQRREVGKAQWSEGEKRDLQSIPKYSRVHPQRGPATPIRGGHKFESQLDEASRLLKPRPLLLVAGWNLQLLDGDAEHRPIRIGIQNGESAFQACQSIANSRRSKPAFLHMGQILA